MRFMPFTLLIAITCSACSVDDIQINLEKAKPEKEVSIDMDQKINVYTEVGNVTSDDTENDKVILVSEKQFNKQETVVDDPGSISNLNVQEQYDSSTDLDLIKQLDAQLTEIDDALALKNNSTPSVISTSNLVSVTAPIPGSTSIKENSDGFGFTIDLSADYLFEFDQGTLTAKAKVALQSITELYTQYDGIGIEIAGHTDSKGSNGYNLALSGRRANAIKQWFESDGISGTTITAAGYGEAQPIAPNSKNDKDNPDGRSLNRRVNITVKTKNKIDHLPNGHAEKTSSDT